MTVTAIPHDYPVTEANCAVKAELGIAKAEWYHGPIPRAELKELMRRSDGPALVTTGLWLGGLIVTGVSAWLLVGSWWSVPFFIVYGVLYGSSADARWHEMGHGTAFRTRWMNEVVYQLACFMLFREPTVWRWSHTRHHTDTIVVGCDPEIVAERPPTIPKMIANLLTLHLGYTLLKNICLHATGRLTVAEKTFIPEQEQWKVYLVARIWLAILAGVVIWSLAAWSILPLMFVGLPTFYGGWLHGMFAITQHVGLAEDVVDHRLNTRTIYFNPVFRFSYLNMNYHIEHHMFPMVPYYNLPKLHEKLKADMPRPYNGLWDAFQEIIPTLLRQRREPDHYVVRQLPPTARPYLRPQPLGAAVPAE